MTGGRNAAPGVRLLRRWGVWVAVVIAAAAALAWGAAPRSTPTLDERTLAIAGQVRCPVCAGESAAQSQAPAAVAIRTQIHAELAEGRPEPQILSDLTTSYGTGILERPPAHGVGLVVWVAPVVAVAAGVAFLGLAFAGWRRRRGGSPAVAGAGPPGVSAEDESLVGEALARPTGGEAGR